MKEILDAIYTRAVNDSALQELNGGNVDLYFNMAPENPDFPYQVHRIQGTIDDLVLGNGSWLLDVWYYGDDAAEAMAIGTRYKELFHHTIDPSLGLQMLMTGFDPVATDAQRVHRIALRFRITWVDKSFVTARVG